jgi:molybdenum cofactor guanylyltransferase
MSVLAAVVLAGGAARRMGGAAKPFLRVGGVALLSRVLAAVPDADPAVVVGPPDLGMLLPAGVVLTQEDPPGGGPVAAAHAGLSRLARTGGAGPTVVALLAADLPFVTATVMARLWRELVTSGAGGVVLVDGTGRPQWLCGLWLPGALAARVGVAPRGASLRDTVAGLRIHTVDADTAGAPAWFDCDTQADLRTAEEWVHADAG